MGRVGDLFRFTKRTVTGCFIVTLTGCTDPQGDGVKAESPGVLVALEAFSDGKDHSVTAFWT